MEGYYAKDEKRFCPSCFLKLPQGLSPRPNTDGTSCKNCQRPISKGSSNKGIDFYCTLCAPGNHGNYNTKLIFVY